jgi:benzoate membrane transport protein
MGRDSRGKSAGWNLRISLLTSALVASLVGFGSTVALVIAAAGALGATPAQTASWLLAVSLAKAVGSAGLSFATHIPVVLAWSTPGAALIATTTGTTMAEAVAAFVLAGLLVVLTGVIKPLGRLVAMIPDGVAAAMLAGVLLPFCLKGAVAAKAEPLLILPMVAVFVTARLFNPALAVLAALSLGLALAFGSGAATLPEVTLTWPALTFIAPEIRPSVLLGLGVPIYLVTMASQNLPGFATLRAAGYTPPVRPALMVTGGLSALTAFFGAHMVNMAAITAAICLGDDVHPDRSQRWKVGLAYGGFWVLLGLLAPIIILLLAALPSEVMTALVALALLGPLMGALTGAYAVVDHRFAATVTIAVAASGVAMFGIGAAFWGLVAGLMVYGLERLRR